MWWIKAAIAGSISLLLLLLCFLEKKKVLQKSYIVKDNELQTGEKKQENNKKYIRIQVKRNERRQINIHCMDLENNRIGELLAVYHKEGRDAGEYQNGNTLHLEQLYVERKYRRKGIGKTMFLYLIKEMKKIEQEEHIEFRYIYGEVGEGGKDNPRISLPFYQKMAEIGYGKDAVLCYQYNRKKTQEEYDRFTYYINRR